VIRRICVFGGPGCGKSTISCRIFAELKIRGHDVEHVPEFVKTMAHEGRFPESYDQIHIFGEQIHREDIALRHVQTTVTDCPILMCCAYAKFYGAPCFEETTRIAQQFDLDFPSLNLYIDRTVEYISKGRYQDDKQALEFDQKLLEFLAVNLRGSLLPVQVENFDSMVEEIEKQIKEE
jgi:nicotinamide riboside kinase